MGDRANVRVVDEQWGSEVFLYSHWGGTELPLIVRDVLAREERWSDSSYLARMVFSAMVAGNIDGSTGYGISSVCGDGDDRIITVDTGTQLVEMPDGRIWSFGDFATLPEVSW